MKSFIIVVAIVTVLTFVTNSEGTQEKRQLRRPRKGRGGLVIPLAFTGDMVKRRQIDSQDPNSENAKNGSVLDKRTVGAKQTTPDLKISTTCVEPPTDLCALGRKFETECNNCLCDPKNGDTVCTTYICSKTDYPMATEKTPPPSKPPTSKPTPKPTPKKSTPKKSTPKKSARKPTRKPKKSPFSLSKLKSLF